MMKSVISIPLFSAQYGVWLSQMSQPDSPHFNIGFSLRLDGELDVLRMRRAVQMVCDESDALRIVIDKKSSSAEQMLLDSCEAPVRLVNISSSKEAVRIAEDLMQKTINSPFEFNGGAFVESVANPIVA